MFELPVKGGFGLLAWRAARFGRDAVGTGGGAAFGSGRLLGMAGGASSLFIPSDSTDRVLGVDEPMLTDLGEACLDKGNGRLEVEDVSFCAED